jgi:hypothetical protein
VTLLNLVHEKNPGHYAANLTALPVFVAAATMRIMVVMYLPFMINYFSCL